MKGTWELGVGDEVFVNARDDFYKQFLKGWFRVTKVESAKDRFTVHSEAQGTTLKMFRNSKGICCIVEHEYNEYGESTWDSVRKQHRFIFVPVDLYAICS